MATVYLSSTTLFELASLTTGDAQNWVVLANLNSIRDPWITGPISVTLPDGTIIPAGYNDIS